MKQRIVVVGCGDVGGRVAVNLNAQNWHCLGLRRSIEQLPVGVEGIAGDVQSATCPVDWPKGGIDYVVYCVAASQHDEAGYRAAYVQGMQHVLGWLEQHRQAPRRIFFVSSTSVYGQSAGEWVDETSVTQVSGFSGKLMLEAEQLLLCSGFSATVVRLSGIYGPGRSRFVEQVREGYRVAESPPLYGNRIHVEDAAGLLTFLVSADAQGVPVDSCYLGVDDAPAPLAEVVGWLRERMQVTRWSDTESVRRTGSKRCSNARAKALGWELRYPSYRDGYAQMV